MRVVLSSHLGDPVAPGSEEGRPGSREGRGELLRQADEPRRGPEPRHQQKEPRTGTDLHAVERAPAPGLAACVDVSGEKGEKAEMASEMGPGWKGTLFPETEKAGRTDLGVWWG